MGRRVDVTSTVVLRGRSCCSGFLGPTPALSEEIARANPGDPHPSEIQTHQIHRIWRFFAANAEVAAERMLARVRKREFVDNVGADLRDFRLNSENPKKTFPREPLPLI